MIVAHEGIGAQGDGPYVREGWVRADAIEPCTDRLGLDQGAPDKPDETKRS